MNTNTRVVNKYKEDYDIYIGRGSKWGGTLLLLVNTAHEKM